MMVVDATTDVTTVTWVVAGVVEVGVVEVGLLLVVGLLEVVGLLVDVEGFVDDVDVVDVLGPTVELGLPKT